MFACGKASFADGQVRGRGRGHNDGLDLGILQYGFQCAL